MPAPRDRLVAAAASGARCAFLSPHLDDAVLSCGALIRWLAPRSEIDVITVFTETTPGPHTRAARSFLRQCSPRATAAAATAAGSSGSSGVPGPGAAGWDADELFAARRAEDRAVLDGLGVAHDHLGLPDALFRRRALPPALAPLGRWLPELDHRYPTFRFDIARGRVSRGDDGLVADVVDRLRTRLADADLVFCPLGVGRHVDHLLTRELGADQRDRTVYYSDFPYDRAHGPDEAFLRRHGLHPWQQPDGTSPDKEDLIRGYGTQADALFGSGTIPRAAETYFVTS